MENPLVTKKLRKTKARNMIISILSQDKDKAFSAEDLHEACGSDLQIDLSTVYRTMNTLVESGFVTKSMHPDGIITGLYAASARHPQTLPCARFTIWKIKYFQKRVLR